MAEEEKKPPNQRRPMPLPPEKEVPIKTGGIQAIDDFNQGCVWTLQWDVMFAVPIYYWKLLSSLHKIVVAATQAWMLCLQFLSLQEEHLSSCKLHDSVVHSQDINFLMEVLWSHFDQPF